MRDSRGRVAGYVKVGNNHSYMGIHDIGVISEDGYVYGVYHKIKVPKIGEPIPGINTWYIYEGYTIIPNTKLSKYLYELEE
jgi:hypothetical protein